MSENLKEILYNSPEIIIDILEELEFDNIRLNGNEIRASLPDGDNTTSVRIKLNEYLSTNIYTRSEFENEYPFRDFISLVQFIKGIRFQRAYEYLCSKVGISSDYVEVETPSIVRVIKAFKNRNICKDEICLSKELLKPYPKYVVPEWIEEDIDPEVQSLFDIRIDKDRRRWLIPSYNEDNQLITVIGRTYLDDFKELGYPKYVYYKFGQETTVNSNLFGINLTKEHIVSNREIIIFEGAKSVMKAYGWGYKNSVAIGGCSITDQQFKKILSLGVNVVIAFDKDKAYKDIKKILESLSRYTNVSYILDKDLLGDKDSPVDKGREVFEKLYQGRKRYG